MVQGEKDLTGENLGGVGVYITIECNGILYLLTMNRRDGSALAGAGGYVSRRPLIDRTVPNEESMIRFAGTREVVEETGESLTALSKLNGEEGLGGHMKAVGAQASAGETGAGGLSEADGPRPGGRSYARLTEEESAAVDKVVGRPTFDEMCILFPLAARLDGDDWLERIKYSRNFWYHIPGKGSELPKVRGPTVQEHQHEFIPFTGQLPAGTAKATKGATQYWIWFPIMMLREDSRLWFRCKAPVGEIISIWEERQLLPTTYGHYLTAPLGVEVMGQQLYLGNRVDDASLHSQKWNGLVSDTEVVGTGRRIAAAGASSLGATEGEGTGHRLSVACAPPADTTGPGRCTSTAGTGGRIFSDAESEETQFMLPAQYSQDKYRDARVPLCAGPVDTKFTSTEQVKRRGAWSSYFVKLAEAIMRLVGRRKEMKCLNRSTP